jgi:CheY-like chemotaxis protein
MMIFMLEDDANRVKFVESKVGHAALEHVDRVDRAICEFLGLDGCVGFSDPDLILLDHDLGGITYQDPGEFNCGTTFAKWMASTGVIKRDTPIIIHTLNFEASRSMLSILQKAGFTNLHLIPFTTLITSWDQAIRLAT